MSIEDASLSLGSSSGPERSATSCMGQTGTPEVRWGPRVLSTLPSAPMTRIKRSHPHLLARSFLASEVILPSCTIALTLTFHVLDGIVGLVSLFVATLGVSHPWPVVQRRERAFATETVSPSMLGLSFAATRAGAPGPFSPTRALTTIVAMTMSIPSIVFVVVPMSRRRGDGVHGASLALLALSFLFEPFTFRFELFAFLFAQLLFLFFVVVVLVWFGSDGDGVCARRRPAFGGL